MDAQLLQQANEIGPKPGIVNSSTCVEDYDSLLFETFLNHPDEAVLQNPTDYRTIQEHQIRDQPLQNMRQILPQQFPIKQISQNIQLIMTQPTPTAKIRIALPSTLVGPMVVWHHIIFNHIG